MAYMWEDNVTMDLKEIGFNTRDWVDSAQNIDYWRAFVTVKLNLSVPYSLELVIYLNFQKIANKTFQLDVFIFINLIHGCVLLFLDTLSQIHYPFPCVIDRMRYRTLKLGSMWRHDAPRHLWSASQPAVMEALLGDKFYILHLWT